MSDPAPPRPLILSMLFVHEMLRRFGFPSDDIFAGYAHVALAGHPAPPMLQGFVRLVRDEKTWQWNLGPCDEPLTQEAFYAEWTAAVHTWNSMESSHDPWGFQKSEIAERAHEALFSIAAKGIDIPAVGRHANEMRVDHPGFARYLLTLAPAGAGGMVN